FPAWLAVVAQVLFWLYIYKAVFALSREERIRRSRAALGWLLLTLFAIAWYRSDKENTIDILKGALSFSPSTGIGVTVLAIAAIATMALTTEFGSQRKLVKGVITQLALIAG